MRRAGGRRSGRRIALRARRSYGFIAPFHEMRHGVGVAVEIGGADADDDFVQPGRSVGPDGFGHVVVRTGGRGAVLDRNLRYRAGKIQRQGYGISLIYRIKADTDDDRACGG